jgi:peptidoglycan/xylan/chitin deacetylase (PgdA/CDA1 family)
VNFITIIKDITRPTRIKYYERKKWSSLVKTVKLQKKSNNVNQNIKYINKPGICFSFDDSFRVDGWYDEVKRLFGYYDIRATFNVNAYHHFEGQREHTQEEIDKLLELQADGHEIAHHTLKHYNAVKYINKRGFDQWINDEIDPLFNWLEKQRHSKTSESFKRPVSFAFPYFSANEKSTQRLVPNVFKVVRGGISQILTPFNATGFIGSIDIDRNILPNPKYIKKILQHIKETGKSAIFTCHSVIEDHIQFDEENMEEDEIKSMKYRINPKTLELIIHEAKKNDLEFYTTADLADVATFIDGKFETYIRKKLNLIPNQWIKISDLINIKELDLRNLGITNLDGLQYFLNLEKLDISHNDIKDLRLIKRLPKLKEVIENKYVKEII